MHNSDTLIQFLSNVSDLCSLDQPGTSSRKLHYFDCVEIYYFDIFYLPVAILFIDLFFFVRNIFNQYFAKMYYIVL